MIGTTSRVSSISTGRLVRAASASPSWASAGTVSSGQRVIVQPSASSARAARREMSDSAAGRSSVAPSASAVANKISVRSARPICSA